MKENDVIKLDNEEKYTLLKKVEHKGSIYFLAAKLKSDDTVDQNNLVFFKEDHEDDELYVDLIKNENLIIELSKAVKKLDKNKNDATK